MSSSYETLTHRALTALFPKTVWHQGLWFDWLRYPPTGNKLQLDLWSPKHQVAIEIQGPQHFRDVLGMSTPRQAQNQRDRDTFKRHRCQELGIAFFALDIFTLSFPDRFYCLYMGLAQALDQPALLRSQFDRMPEVQAVTAEASRLSRRKVKPWRAKNLRRRYRLPGVLNLLRRAVGAGGYR
jgi:hypothetical protein